MKRLLTYGLLLLTILASHFVVSACQDDSDKTTIIMTFTTRIDNTPQSTTPGEEAEVEVEQMKELRIIMARKDGTVIHNEKQPVTGNEHTFSFDVPMMAYTENFQFVAIANESTLGLDFSEVEVNNKTAFNDLKTLVIGSDGFFFDVESQCIPQTIYWAQDIIYGETTKIRKELQFVVGKITIEFENQTEEPQSLSDIHIKGIIPNAQGYLLAQASNDFVGTQHDASAMQAADIIFNSITDLSVGGSSPIQHYYTYPVGSYGVASSTLSFTQSEKTYEQPTLFATWNGIEYNLPITKVTDEEGNVHPFTSLARNERLKIVITLTPAGDITVNYEVDEWIDTPTNIGGEAPTTPGNGYHVDTWGASNDIEIGGGGQIWELGNGTTIKGEEVSGATLVEIQRGGRWDLTEHLNPAENYIQAGYTLVIYFEPHFYYEGQPEEGDVNIQFKSGWDSDIGDVKTSYPRKRGASYVKYLEFKDTMNGINIDGENGLQTQNLSVHITSDIDSGDAIYIVKFAIIKPILTANP